MSSALGVRFDESERGILQAEFSVPLHCRLDDILIVKRGHLSPTDVVLDHRDSMLLKQAVEVLLEGEEEVEVPLFVDRFKMRIHTAWGSTAEAIERIKQLIIEICIGCGLYNIIEVHG